MTERIKVSKPVNVTDILRSAGYDASAIKFLTRNEIVRLIQNYYLARSRK